MDNRNEEIIKRFEENENLDDNKEIEDIENFEESEENDESGLSFNIRTYPADNNLEAYVMMLDKDEILLPDFQRKTVWNNKTKVRLIESFLLGLPVPNLFLYKEKNAKNFLLIDGWQRLSTVSAFFNNKFTLKNTTQEKWENKKFKNLDEDDQFSFKKTILRAVIIEQLSPDNNSSINMIFERINNGSVPLSAMEIRRCVSSGNYLNQLEELNKNEKWRKLLYEKKEIKRYKDVEILLRVFALHSDLDSYQAPTRRFLDNYIRDNKDKNPLDLDDFTKTIDCLFEVYEETGKKPFYITNTINIAVLDSLVISILRSFKKGIKKDYIKQKAKDLILNPDDFLNNYIKGKGTNEKVVIEKRIMYLYNFFANED